MSILGGSIYASEDLKARGEVFSAGIYFDSFYDCRSMTFKLATEDFIYLDSHKDNTSSIVIK